MDLAQYLSFYPRRRRRGNKDVEEEKDKKKLLAPISAPQPIPPKEIEDLERLEKECLQSDMSRICKVFFCLFTFYLFYLFIQYRASGLEPVVLVNNANFTTLGPYDVVDNKTTDIENLLIDMGNFSFLTNDKPCQGYDKGLLLLIMVTSNASNYGRRQAVRSTWGRATDWSKVVFLVGDRPKYIASPYRRESQLFGDIVKGNFMDENTKMTYKHVMGLKWVVNYCPMAKYVLKVDDDVLVNMPALRQFLVRELSPWGAKDLIACEVKESSKVERSSKSNWKVTVEEYPDEFYPTYCSGWAILYSQNVVHRLLTAAQATPYFRIDNVHITGVIAERLKIDRVPFSSLILNENRFKLLKSLGLEYAGQFLFGPCDPDADSEFAIERGMYDIWKVIIPNFKFPSCVKAIYGRG